MHLKHIIFQYVNFFNFGNLFRSLDLSSDIRQVGQLNTTVDEP